MKLLFQLALTVLFCGLSMAAENDHLQWPREIEKDTYRITVYQPQPETFEKNILQGRMAISIKPRKDDMLFCAAWFTAKMETDLEQKIITLKSITITTIHFPDFEDKTLIEKLTNLLENQIASWNLVMSLDRFTASLADVDGLGDSSVPLNNKPPAIYFRTVPSVLVTIEGDPILEQADKANIEYVVNTAFFIAREKGKKRFYLNGGYDYWYISEKLTGTWKQTPDVPGSIQQLAKDNKPPEFEEPRADQKTEIPEIVVVTEPSELIYTEGEPAYQAVEGSSLLYVQNSNSEIVMDVNSQYHYVLISGRWFRSKSLKDGSWSFVEPSDLPDVFNTIPERSKIAAVRSSIPGTIEAQDALLEQTIPQTAVVDRKTTTVEVQYDGKPEFKEIDGTEISYAVNSDKTVLKIKQLYYCVDDGIWFVAKSAAGPWSVSDERPEEVDDIPADSPVYNVKYVHIYDSTPEVVYVGYYPGYCHSYVYGGVVVYGTGYWYRPWYHHYYYPRPCTYGFGVHWNSVTGWGFSFGFSYGWIGWGFHPYPYRYWGPRGYHHGYRHGYRHGFGRGFRAGYRLKGSERPVLHNTVNVYNNRKTGIVKSATINRTEISNKVKERAANMKPSSLPNDHFVDKKGNIYQRAQDGNWIEKKNKSTLSLPGKKSAPQIKNKTNMQNIPKPQRQIPQKQLNNYHNNRARGEMRMNRSRASGAARARAGKRR